MASVDEAEVRKLAALARIALTPDEAAAVAADLDRLLAYVARIQLIDVAGASETAHVAGRNLPLREDVARPGIERALVLASAPATASGLFEVPRVVGGAAGDDGEAAR